MRKHDPAQLEREWREALAALIGDELAQVSKFTEDGGWYYTAWGQRFPDGSVGCISRINDTGKRASGIIVEIARIRERVAAGEGETDD